MGGYATTNKTRKADKEALKIQLVWSVSVNEEWIEGGFRGGIYSSFFLWGASMPLLR